MILYRKFQVSFEMIQGKTLSSCDTFWAVEKIRLVGVGKGLPLLECFLSPTVFNPVPSIAVGELSPTSITILA